MAAPRQPVNGSTTSVGFTTKLVTVQAVSADGKTAVAVDRQNHQVSVPMMIQRSKGLLPAVGETWLVTQDLGQYTFAAVVAQSASQFQTQTGAQGVYSSATAPGNPAVGELWVNPSLGNIVTAWNGTSWVPLQFGGTAIQAGSLTSQQLSAEANIAASQVNFTASDIGGITTTISATQPNNPSFGDLWYNASQGYQLNQWSGTQWVPYQWGTQSISARAVTAELIAANTITAEEMAAGIIYGGIINGTIVDAATFIGSVFEGTDFLINSAGAFFYNAAPGLGNLLATITAQSGTDEVGNPFQAGIFLYGPGGSFAAMVDNGSEASLLLNPAGAQKLTWSPQVFSFTGNPGAVNEYTWLVLTSGKESNQADAAIQLFSESADGSIQATMVVEFGGTVFATITKTGMVLPGGGTPPFVPGSSSLYSTSAGTLQVVDGVDGEAYGTQRRSLFTGGSQPITSTTFGNVLSSVVGQRSYRIHGMIYVVADQSAGQFALQWNAAGSPTGLINFMVAEGLNTWTVGPKAAGNPANPGLTMSSGTVYVVMMDGVITVTTAGQFGIQAACVTSGDTFHVAATSFVDILPV
jgi:hypothetical protein